MLRRVVLALVLLAAPLSAVAQTGDPARRIEDARRRAQTVGIPVALLDAKVAEGTAKGVPMDRIAGAVEHRLDALQRARDAMGAGPRNAPVSAQDLALGADALDAGVSPAALGALTASAPTDRRAVAIAVLTQLVRGGEASDRALRAVLAAASQGADALRDLPARVAQEHGNRGNPAGRGNAGGASGAAHGHGSGPPSSVPGPGKKPERGGGNGTGNGTGNGSGNGNGNGHGKGGGKP